LGRSLRRCRDPGLFNRDLHRFVEVSSTNDVAKELAVKGAHEGVVVLAEKQSRGRGRNGRDWFSPVGGLWLTIILRPKIMVDEAYKLTFMAGVAVANVLRKYGISPLIKWPNDVFVDGKKISGILTEVNSKKDYVDFALVGIGINVNNAISELVEKHGFSAVSLRECLNEKIDFAKFLGCFLSEFEKSYIEFSCVGFEPILEKWKNDNLVLNRFVEVYELGKKFSGVAIGIDSTGALLVRTENDEVKTVVSGDIRLVERVNPKNSRM
jgi:BirA family biotin operon repressor/biotin-[acetyl-CoA-carboxylase] ligase